MRAETNKILLSLLVSLIVGYAATWAVPYLTFLYSEAPTYLDASIFKTNCDAVGYSEAQCKFGYKIPVNLIKNNSKKILNLGVIVPSYKFSCDESGIAAQQDLGVIDNRNSIAKIQTSQLGCKNNFNLTIWESNYYRLSGVVSGSIFLASEEFSKAYSELTEFFFINFRLVLLLFFAFSISISVISRRLKLPRLCESFPDIYLIPWALFLLSSSGTLSVLVGGIIPGKYYVHLNSFFSSAANLGPVLFVLMSALLKDRVAIFCSFAAAAAVPILVPSWLTVYPWLGMVCSFFASALAFRRSDYFAISYFATYIITLLKLQGFLNFDPTWLPHIHFSAVYLGCIYLFTSMRRIAVIVHIFKLNLPAASAGHSETSDSFMGYSLKSIAAVLPVRSQKLWISFPDSDRVREFDLIGDDLNVVEKQSNELASKVIHAFSVSGENGMTENMITTGDKDIRITVKNFGGFSAVLILEFFSMPIDANAKADFNLAVNSIADFMWRSVSRYNLIRKIEVTEMRKSISEKLRTAKSISDLFKIANKYFAHKNIRGFLGEVDISTRKVPVLETFGYEEDITHFLRRLHFTSEDSGSTNAPIPLAVSRQTPVSIENISLIKPYLSTYSHEFLTAAKTQSLAVFPYFIFDDEKKLNRTFVLYCDSQEVARFDYVVSAELEFFFSCLVTALLRMSKLESSQSALNVLSKTVPSHVLSKLREGKSIREEGVGYLFCVDIIGSTPLYKNLGEKKWIDFVDALSNCLHAFSKKYSGASHDLVVWDAFFLTLPDRYESEAACVFASNLYKEVEFFLKDFLKSNPNFNVASRVCLTFGDVTKDFSNGVNPAWTIVGGAMARVCKFESSVKKLGPGIYIDPSSEISFPNSLVKVIPGSNVRTIAAVTKKLVA